MAKKREVKKGSSVERYYENKKKRQKRRAVIFYTLLLVFLLTCVAVLSMTVFFNLVNITVTGEKKYSETQIISASGLQKGQNLFRLNKFKVIDTMMDKLPYAKDITIKRKLPDTLEIKVNETTGKLRLENGDDVYILDEDLKILEKLNPGQESKLPDLLNVNFTSGKVGEKASFSTDFSDSINKLITAFDKQNIYQNVCYIDMKDKFNINIGYDNERVKIIVGGVDNIDQKLRMLKYVLEQNSTKEQAVVDISNPDKTYYRPLTK